MRSLRRCSGVAALLLLAGSIVLIGGPAPGAGATRAARFTARSAPVPSASASIASGVAAATTASFTEPNGFWSVDYPKTWVQKKVGSEQQFLTDRSGTAGFAVSVQIKAVKATTLVEEIADLLASKRSKYEELDRGLDEIDGLEAAWIEHGYEVDGEAYAGMLVGIVRNRVGVLIVAWTPDSGKEEVQEAFQAFAASLRITRFDEAPDYGQWIAKRSTHFTYRYLPESYVASSVVSVAKAHEAAYTTVVKTLGVKPTGSIAMYFYPSMDSLYRATARDSGFAITEAREVHTVWVSGDDHQSLGHEMTHVITASTIGEPSEALLGEGIAVCLDQAAPSPRARAAALLRSGSLVPVADLLGDGFFETDPVVAYSQSGSVACWMLEQYGAAKFRRIYAEKDFTAALRSVYGLTVAALEQRWLASLKG